MYLVIKNQFSTPATRLSAMAFSTISFSKRDAICVAVTIFSHCLAHCVLLSCLLLSNLVKRSLWKFPHAFVLFSALPVPCVCVCVGALSPFSIDSHSCSMFSLCHFFSGLLLLFFFILVLLVSNGFFACLFSGFLMDEALNKSLLLIAIVK